MNNFDVGTLPRPFMKPVLVLTGRQDSIVGYKDAWNGLENYSRATFAVLARAGHGLGEEQKDLFRALSSEWLTRVEQNS